MLENTGPEGSAMIEKCKPDYEKQILNAKERLNKNQNFQDAIFNYMGDIRLRDKMAELVGELVSESRQLKISIEQMIKAQEEEK
jgi:hypothetical protein